MHLGFRNEIWGPDAKHTTVYADFIWFKNYFSSSSSFFFCAIAVARNRKEGWCRGRRTWVAVLGFLNNDCSTEERLAAWFAVDQGTWNVGIQYVGFIYRFCRETQEYERRSAFWASERILCSHKRICVFHVVLTTSTDCFPRECCPVNLSDEHGLSAPRSENWSCCALTS